MFTIIYIYMEVYYYMNIQIIIYPLRWTNKNVTKDFIVSN